MTVELGGERIEGVFVRYSLQQEGVNVKGAGDAGTGVGWELQEAPVMLPEKRYEQVLSRAVEAGLL